MLPPFVINQAPVFVQRKKQSTRNKSGTQDKEYKERERERVATTVATAMRAMAVLLLLVVGALDVVDAC